ncbi:MAG: 3-methyl-2-oxobutanoate hydroxymethyltransferase [Pseudanabaena sp. CRU_2_10]|nr:3-methyl-2-oxobutanoate hydroxymethyltransferase [Pseudanabaena sp. CRU_2_10]
MPVSVQKLLQYKPQAKPIVMLTAWDYMSARMVDQAGADIVLAGDSMAMAALGHSTTLPLTLDEMLYHTRAVRRGVEQALLVCDLPFLSYQESLAQAIRNAGRALKEAGAQAVKLEGGYPAMVETITRLVEVGIPVMGHIGLTPQSIHLLGLRQQGREEMAQGRLIGEAIALQQAGVFAIVLEHIPNDLAKVISQKLSIPTIGIGAGPDCDGQVLVSADLWGLNQQPPPFAKVYVDLRTAAIQAAQAFCEDVRQHRFEV